MAQYDVCVIGLGAMGSAAAWHLARSGASVIGLDQFSLGHANGSSHGKTRIIRTVYSEGNVYDDLVAAAYRGWDDIARMAGQDFFRCTGGLDISLRRDGIFEDALAAALTSGHDFEVIEGLDLETRFPAIDLGGRGRAVFAPGSGLLDSDEASAWMREDAIRNGADLRGETPVSGWRREPDGFTVETVGEVIQCRKLVIAAGAWCGELVPSLKPVLVPERQVIAWYPADGPEFDTLPIFQLETEDRERYYFFPPHRGQGLKLGLYNHRRERGYQHIQARGVDEEDMALLDRGASLCLPTAGRSATETAECRFTNAPGDRFIMGCWPQDRDIILLSPCSGHGYKFAPVIGEIAARLVLERDTPVDIGAFAVERVV